MSKNETFLFGGKTYLSLCIYDKNSHGAAGSELQVLNS